MGHKHKKKRIHIWPLIGARFTMKIMFADIDKDMLLDRLKEAVKADPVLHNLVVSLQEMKESVYY